MQKIAERVKNGSMARPKKGLVQSRGIGDIIIALPIAKYFSDRGYDVFWPIDRRFMSHFVNAAPYVTFLPLEPSVEPSFYYDIPLAKLREIGCSDIHVLYSALRGREHVVDQKLADYVTFDRYKYAVAGVPFREKWNLSLVRNRKREQALFERLIEKPTYTVCHFQGSAYRVELDVPATPETQVIRISEVTDCVFDWITILERAAARVLIDSCFANLVEQLSMTGKKDFIRNPLVPFSPVLINDWEFLR